MVSSAPEVGDALDATTGEDIQENKVESDVVSGAGGALLRGLDILLPVDTIDETGLREDTDSAVPAVDELLRRMETAM